MKCSKCDFYWVRIIMHKPSGALLSWIPEDIDSPYWCPLIEGE